MVNLSLEEQVKMITAIGQRQLVSSDESARLELQSEEENAVYTLLSRQGMVKTLGGLFKPEGKPYDVVKCRLTPRGIKVYQAAEDNLQKGIELLQYSLRLPAG